MISVVLSFDDGRADNMRVVDEILAPRGTPATFNIATAFVDGTISDENRPCPNPAMRIKDVRRLASMPFIELAGHGDEHLNTMEDLSRGLTKLRGWLGGADSIVDADTSDCVIGVDTDRSSGSLKCDPRDLSASTPTRVTVDSVNNSIRPNPSADSAHMSVEQTGGEARGLHIGSEVDESRMSHIGSEVDESRGSHFSDPEDSSISEPTPKSIVTSIFSTDICGIASPNSNLTASQILANRKAYEDMGIEYVRIGPGDTYSGIRRISGKLSRMMGNNKLFWESNKGISEHFEGTFVVHSIPIMNPHSIEQVKYLVSENAKRGTDIALMFHSIIKRGEEYYDDTWSYDYDNFVLLVEWLISREDVILQTMRDAVRGQLVRNR